MTDSIHSAKMGQGQEHKTRDDPQLEIQERGEIFFFYRPKVNKEEVHSVDDVQRLYIVLRPESGERGVEEKQDPHSGKEGAKSRSGDQPQTGSSMNETEGGQGSQVRYFKIPIPDSSHILLTILESTKSKPRCKNSLFALVY